MFRLRSISFFFLLFSIAEINGQTIIVRGKPSNGKLTWEDFTGKPNEQSAFYAQTAARIYPDVRSPKLFGDTVRFRHVEVMVELDSVASWLRPNERTVALLAHEQTHFDIAILCARDYLNQLKTTIFTRRTVDSLLNHIYDQSMKKYLEMQKRYDEETRNGKDKMKQKEWNNRVAIKLAEG